MLIVYDERYTEHLRDVPQHPERPDRVRVAAEYLARAGRFDDRLRARAATPDELALVHPLAYIERVRVECERLGAGGAAYLSTGDTVIDASSYDVARFATGGALVALERAVAEKRGVFALVRPPGHHATPARGMGFCVFNSAAVVARTFVEQTGERALVIDFDYHHGNGTQAAAGAGVSYVSSHAYPDYPGTGTTDENRYERDGAIVNFPLPIGQYGTEPFAALWEQALRTVAARVRPRLLVVSAGYDFLRGDPVGDLGIDESVSSVLGRACRAVAEEFCDGRAVFVLEGGYDPDALARSIEATMRGFDTPDAGLGAPDVAAIPGRERRVLEAVWSGPA